MISDDYRKLFYSQYPARKNWFGTADYRSHGDRFAKELHRAKTPPQGRLLEIGFGDGLFLDWARAEGFTVEGIELNADFCAAARSRGHAVECGDAVKLLEGRNDRYDLVVLFDVLEHLRIDEIVQLLRSLRACLAADGKVLATFPNGQSPFGRVYQHGDVTHVTTLSVPIMTDIAPLADMRVVAGYNRARSALTSRSTARRLARKLSFAARDIVQWTVGQIYFQAQIPLDPNVTVVLSGAEAPPLPLSHRSAP